MFYFNMNHNLSELQTIFTHQYEKEQLMIIHYIL
jgi:hypothetical protein